MLFVDVDVVAVVFVVDYSLELVFASVIIFCTASDTFKKYEKTFCAIMTVM